MFNEWHYFNVQTSATASADVEQPGVVQYDPTAGTMTLTIATALVRQPGQTLLFKNKGTSTNQLTIATEGAETIDGANTVTNSTARGRVILVSDGTNWMTMLNT